MLPLFSFCWKEADSNLAGHKRAQHLSEPSAAHFRLQFDQVSIFITAFPAGAFLISFALRILWSPPRLWCSQDVRCTMSSSGLLKGLPKMSNCWVLRALSQGWGERGELRRWQAGWSPGAGGWRLGQVRAGYLTTAPCGLRRAPGDGDFSPNFAQSCLGVPLACLHGGTPLLPQPRTC